MSVVLAESADTSHAETGLLPWSQDWAAWLAGALTTVILAWHAAPAGNFLDSGELIAAARTLGVVHPPGHPAWLSWAQLAEWLPFGPHAVRVAWLSALAAGLSAVLTVRIGRQLLQPHVQGTTQTLWVLAGALVLPAAGSLWQVGTRAEVYTLALLTNLVAVYAGLEASAAATTGRRVQEAVVAAVAVALGLCNHHYVTLFALPAVLAAGSGGLRKLLRDRPALLLWPVAAAASLGLLYLALAWRDLSDAEIRWGHPATWQGWWDHVTAKHFARSVTGAQVNVVDNAMVLLGMLAVGLGGLLALPGILGVAVGWLRRDRGLAVLVLLLVGGVATKALMQIDTGNPDDHGYVLLALVGLALGLTRLGSVLPGKALAAAVLAGVVGLGGWQVQSLAASPQDNLSDLRLPATLDDDLRRTLAPGAILASNYYGLQFAEQQFRLGEGRRPDVIALHLSARTGDTDGGTGFLRWLQRTHPELEDVVLTAAQVRRAPVGALLVRAETQPVYVEQDPEARIPPASYGFDGMSQRLLTQPERWLDLDLHHWQERQNRRWQRLYDRVLPQDLADKSSRAVLLWQHALQAAHALRRGWMDIARDELARAQKLQPGDHSLIRLQQRLAALEAAWQRADTKGFTALWKQYASMDLTALLAEP